MLHDIKIERAPVGFADPADITLGEFLSALGGEAERPLVFSCEGRPVKAGYHVTEVKAAQFASLDCGANPEAWTEIFVQLWDVEDGARQHMAAGKFASIIRKVSGHVGLDASARLTFEVSDGVAPMALYRAGAPLVAEGEVKVALSARPASCKPRDRWLVSNLRRRRPVAAGDPAPSRVADD